MIKRLLILSMAIVFLGCVTAEHKACMADLAASKDNSSKLAGEAEACKKDLAATKSDLDGCRKGELETCRKDLSSCRVNFDSCKQESKAIAEQIEGARSDTSSCRNDLQSCLSETSICRNIRVEVDVCRRDNVDMKLKLTNAETEKARISGENEGMKKQIDSMKNEQSKIIEREKETRELAKTKEMLLTEMNKEIKKGEITITQLKDKLTVSMVEKILFDSGSADIKSEGKKILKRVGEILATMKDRQVKVEGHTDNVPISARLIERFPTNWELSTARATTVVRYLEENSTLNPKLLIAAGYGEHRPIAPNTTAEEKAKNRRIEILLIPLDK